MFKEEKHCELEYLSVVPLLRRVADIWRVGQHVGPVYVIDGLGLWQGCQVLVVQHLLSQFGLTAETRTLSSCIHDLLGILCFIKQRCTKPNPA